jgi:hypothetical protein
MSRYCQGFEVYSIEFFVYFEFVIDLDFQCLKAA